MDKNIPWFNKKIPPKVSKKFKKMVLERHKEFELKERYMVGTSNYE